MEPTKEADSKNKVILSRGLIAVVDLTQLTMSEYRKMFDTTDHKEECALLSRCTGLKPEQISELNVVDFQKLRGNVVRICSDAFSNPT